MGIISGFFKYKALKSGFQIVKNALKKKSKSDPAVQPYKTTATY